MGLLLSVTDTPIGKAGIWAYLKRLRRQSQLDFFPLSGALKGYKRGEPSRLMPWRGSMWHLLAFPQGMAYAMIAGLPVEYGLFGSAFALILGMVFSGSKFIVLGRRRMRPRS